MERIIKAIDAVLESHPAIDGDGSHIMWDSRTLLELVKLELEKGFESKPCKFCKTEKWYMLSIGRSSCCFSEKEPTIKAV